jgi:hypothetical protein
MLPEIWGKHFWYMLHFITLEYPENPSDEHKLHYSQYLHDLTHVLPCEKCSKEYMSYITSNPPSIDNRDTLFSWSVDFHNYINIHLNKPCMSLEQARKMYQVDMLKSFYDKAMHTT